MKNLISVLCLSFLLIPVSAFAWWSDDNITIKCTGVHTKEVQLGTIDTRYDILMNGHIDGELLALTNLEIDVFHNTGISAREGQVKIKPDMLLGIANNVVGFIDTAFTGDIFRIWFDTRSSTLKYAERFWVLLDVKWGEIKVDMECRKE